MEELLKIENLTIEYRNESEHIQAVNDVSLSMRTGEVLGLVGETGAGKTTIAKGILRILPEASSQVLGGKILFEGDDLMKLPESEMRRIRGKKISMIFQDPMTALNPVMSVGDQIAEAIRLHEKVSRMEAQRRAVDMLESVGIPGERYGEYPYQFSGGMKQRVIIAIALACNPRLLLADEPTTALDVTIQAQVIDMILKLKEKLGTSILMITHDLGVVAEMCDRVAVVYAGRIVEAGTREDIFDHTQHPYTQGLFHSVPRIGHKCHKLIPIPGNVPNPAKLPTGCAFHPRCACATEECKKTGIPMRETSPGHFVRCLHSGL